MVTITDYKTYESKEGKMFHSLEVQGGVELIKSQDTGRTYLTARKANVPCTFSEAMCKSLLGEKMPGQIIKKAVSAYDYKVPETGEIISLQHSYEFVDDSTAILNENIVERQVVE
jgi:hypothetical protein